MNTSRITTIIALAAVLFVHAAPATASDPTHDAFTYQGQLRHNGEPIAGPVNFAFRLYNASAGGSQIGPELEAFAFNGFDEDGRFTMDLEFTKGVFDGTQLWLEIVVDGTTLSPRQPIMPTPYAIRALNVATVTDPALAGTYTNPLNLTNPGNVFVGSGAGLLNLHANNIATGNLNIARAPTGGNWSLGSTLNIANNNLVVNPSSNRVGLGTSNPLAHLHLARTGANVNLLLKRNDATHGINLGVNEQPKLFFGRTAGDGIYDDIMVIDGLIPGAGRVGIGTTLPQAALHVVQSGDGPAVILPGLRVINMPLSPNVVAGSDLNHVSGFAVGAVIGGGGMESAANQITAGFGTISGGVKNTAGNLASIGGGSSNVASGPVSTVAGGFLNTAEADYATIGGGLANVASADSATVGGGGQNTASGESSTVGGGKNNNAVGSDSTVGGGSGNTASGQWPTIGGGLNNAANNNWATIGGGSHNTASGVLSTIGGGWINTASGNFAMVPGGHFNRAQGDYSLAAGRRAVAAHDGAFVWADSTDADFTSTGSNQFLIRATGGVGIGTNNPTARLHVADGQFVVSGAAGRIHAPFGGVTNPTYRFGVATSTEVTGFASPSGNTITLITNGAERVRFTSTGEVGIGTSNPSTFRLAVNGDAAKPGGGLWSVFSDARLKHNIEPLAPGTLDQLLALRGYTFEYEDHAVEHRLALPGKQVGLIAQEVAEVFPDWVDADDEGYLYITERGLTAIVVEALRDLRDEKDTQIAHLNERVAELETLRDRVAELEATIAHLAGIIQKGEAR